MPNKIKRWKGFLPFFLIVLLNFVASAQNAKIDDLLNQLSKSTSDTAQIKVLRKLSTAYTSVDPSKKYIYANQYRILAEKNGIDSLIASGYLDMGTAYAIKSNLDSALIYFKLGQDIAKRSNFENGIARSYVNIGYTYDRLDRKKEAVAHYEKALKIYKQLNFKRGINQCITNLGSIYFDLKQYKTAELYFQQVLENLKETPNDQMGLGSALYTLGGTSRRLGKSKQAMVYYQRSLTIKETLGDLSGIALANWGIGQLYVAQKNMTKRSSTLILL